MTSAPFRCAAASLTTAGLAFAIAGSASADHIADAYSASDRSDSSLVVLGIPAKEMDPKNGTGHEVFVFDIVTPPGLGAPPHVHSLEDEIVFVREGTYEMVLGDSVTSVGTGDVLYMPRGVPHGFRNVSGAESASTWIVVPGESFRGFFRELAALPPGPPDMEKIAAIFAAYSIELLPPD